MSELIYGLQSISALAVREPHRLLEVFTVSTDADSRRQSLIKQLTDQGITCQRVSSEWLTRKTAGATHQGIAARIHPPTQYDEQQLPELWRGQIPFLLILDGVTDPHNLGACLRSADAVGVQAVIIPRNRSVSYNATVSKVACGAAERVPLVAVTNLARTLQTLQSQGIWIVGTSAQATPLIYQQSLTGPLALVMGAEGHGLRRLTTERCDAMASLPMAGIVSSLNVSVATGICLFEAIRQRTKL